MSKMNCLEESLKDFLELKCLECYLQKRQFAAQRKMILDWVQRTLGWPHLLV